MRRKNSTLAIIFIWLYFVAISIFVVWLARTETPFNPIDGIWIIAQRMGAVVEHFWVKYI